jgi:hypothetical protein
MHLPPQYPTSHYTGSHYHGSHYHGSHYPSSHHPSSTYPGSRRPGSHLTQVRSTLVRIALVRNTRVHWFTLPWFAHFPGTIPNGPSKQPPQSAHRHPFPCEPPRFTPVPTPLGTSGPKPSLGPHWDLRSQALLGPPVPNPHWDLRSQALLGPPVPRPLGTSGPKLWTFGPKLSNFLLKEGCLGHSPRPKLSAPD